MQARCDITHLPIHFDELISLVDNILPQLKREEPLVNEDLRELIVMERSRDRWTPKEYNDALDTLQLGEDSPLLLGIFETDATFLENAYKQLLYETWRPPTAAPSSWSEQVKMKMEPGERRQVLKNAVRIAAEGTGREEFYQVWKKISEPWSSMDPEKAYTTLGVPKDTTEDMLLTVYNLRVRSKSTFVHFPGD
jgi:ubiquitin carboxyl-terminal hydrolase 25/28